MSESHSDDRAVRILEVGVPGTAGGRAGVELSSTASKSKRHEPVDIAGIVDAQADVLDAASEMIALAVCDRPRLAEDKRILGAWCLEKHDPRITP